MTLRGRHDWSPGQTQRRFWRCLSGQSGKGRYRPLVNKGLWATCRSLSSRDELQLERLRVSLYF
jgi:hypothetical protein